MDQNKKRTLIALLSGIACFFLLAFIFLLVYFFNVKGTETKSLSEKICDDYSSFSEYIDTSAEDIFCTDQDIYAVAFVFQVSDVQPEGNVNVQIFDADTGAMLAESNGEMKNILPNQYSGFGLDRKIDGHAGARYRIAVTPHYQNKGKLSIGYSSNPSVSDLLINGQLYSGQVALLITTKQIGGFISRFYLAVFLLLAIIISIFVTIYLLLRPRIHILYFCAALILGVFYSILLPPYSAPDEQFHINQAFSVATTLTTKFPLGSVPIVESYRRPSDSDLMLQNERTTVFTWKEMAETAFTSSPDKTGSYQLYEEMQADDSDLLYTFSALAVAFCFLIRAGFTQALILGRMANLLMYCLATSLAVRLIPFGKKILSVIGLLPMCLHLAASFSRDSMTLSLTFLFTAASLYVSFSQNQITWKHIIPLTLLGIVTVQAKVAYFPLVFLLLLVPCGRFAFIRSHKRCFKFSLVAICLFALMFSSARYTISSILTRADSPDELVTQSEQLSEEEELSWQLAEKAESADSICYSPRFILQNPGRTIRLVVNTVLTKSEHYLKSLVGGELSYYSVDISWIWVVCLYCILLFSMIPNMENTVELSVCDRVHMLLISLLCFGLVVAGCLLWTPTYYEEIYGMQGRYFLPALPLSLIALQPNAKKICSSFQPASIVPIMLVLNTAVLLNIFLIILAR